MCSPCAQEKRLVNGNDFTKFYFFFWFRCGKKRQKEACSISVCLSSHLSNKVGFCTSSKPNYAQEVKKFITFFEDRLRMINMGTYKPTMKAAVTID